MSKILMNDKNVRKSHKKLFCILGGIVVAFAVLLYVTVTMSGHWLVKDDEFEHVKWAVILDGQSADLERNDYVATLLAEGRVDSVVILGRRVYRNKSNVDFYAEDFMTLGRFNPETIFLVHHDDPSTLSEACTVIPWLKKHKADSVLLVTSAPATRRSAKIFSSLSGDSPVYLTADIHSHLYNADTWLFSREMRKAWVREWLALASTYVDLIGTGTFTEKDSTYFSTIRSLAEIEKDEPIIDLQQFQAAASAVKDTAKTDTVSNSNQKDTVKTDSATAK